MLINVNTKSLIESGLTPSQYICLHLLFEGKLATYEEFVDSFDLHQELEGLVPKYIFKYDQKTRPETLPLNKAEIRNLLELDDSSFWELFSTYPLKVSSRGGARYLRPASCDADQTKVLKKKYEAILKKRKNVHSHVMRCLNAELWFRKRGNNMPYMHNMETWLNRREWQKYEHLLELSSARKTQSKYGEDII